MKLLFYKKDQELYYFCSILHNYTKCDECGYFILERNEGLVGQYADFDPVISKDYRDIENEVARIEKEFPDAQPQSVLLKLTVNLKEYYPKFNNWCFEDLIFQIWFSAKNVTVHSGLGYFNLPQPVDNIQIPNFIYKLEFDVVEKESFQKHFFEIMDLIGIKQSDILIT